MKARTGSGLRQRGRRVASGARESFVRVPASLFECPQSAVGSYPPASRRPPTAVRLRRSLGTLSLVFILYFTTSGGPYTTETLVKSVGPGLALLILVLVPLVWSIPEVLIIGELASMLPEEGGYYRWVQRAFGSFWAFQNGWLTWMYSLVDMAIYPVLFNEYFRYFVPGLSPAVPWFVSLAVIWGATARILSDLFDRVTPLIDQA